MLPTWQQIAVDAPLGVPVLLAAFGNILAAAVAVPVLASGVSSEAARQGMELMVWLVAALAPVVVLVKCLLLALVTWLLSTALGDEVRIRSTVSLLAYAELVHVLAALVAAAFLHAGGPELIAALPGVLALPPSSEPMGAGAALRQHATVFHAAWVAMIAVGLKRVHSLPVRCSLFIALLLWSLMVALTSLQLLVFT